MENNEELKGKMVEKMREPLPGQALPSEQEAITLVDKFVEECEKHLGLEAGKLYKAYKPQRPNQKLG